MATSSTTTSVITHPAVELTPLPSLTTKRASTAHSITSSKSHSLLPPPSPSSPSSPSPQSWRANIHRLSVTFYSFLVLGLDGASCGALIPYLETYYSLRYTIVSLIFLSPFVGYTLSSLLNNTIHLRFGQRGVAFLGPLCHVVAYVIIVFHPPYPVLVAVFALAGFGNGLLDAAWNAWIGAMDNANEILGVLHAWFGLGATIAPLGATALIAKGGLEWYYWYYVMLGAAALELILSVHAFWGATGKKFRDENERTTDEQGSRLREAIMKKPAAKVTWLCALFLFGYVGVEIALGGWIVTFMIRVRQGAPFASGLTATGFWLGLTVGRVVLGFVTPRIGEKLAIAIYLPLSAVCELLFWLIPQFYVSAVAVAWQGFFLGPLFPAAVVATTKLLPKHLHVSGIGFAAAFGGSGAAVFPFAVGAIAQSKGVQVLQPIILALLVVIWGLWMLLPKMPRKID